MARKSTISETCTLNVELNGKNISVRVYYGYDFKRNRYNVRISANGLTLRTYTYYPTFSAKNAARKSAECVLSSSLSVSDGKDGVMSYKEYYNRYCEKDPIGAYPQYLSDKGNFLKLSKMFGGYDGIADAMLQIRAAR